MKWVGVDLDGILAEWYGHPPDVMRIGPPIPRMVERVKALLAAGEMEVRIFTAHVAACGTTSEIACDDQDFADHQREMIVAWCQEHLGQVLRVTATKDWEMVELWDDRCKQVISNTGELVEEHLRETEEILARTVHRLAQSAEAAEAGKG